MLTGPRQASPTSLEGISNSIDEYIQKSKAQNVAPLKYNTFSASLPIVGPIVTEFSIKAAIAKNLNEINQTQANIFTDTLAKDQGALAETPLAKYEQRRAEKAQRFSDILAFRQKRADLNEIRIINEGILSDPKLTQEQKQKAFSSFNHPITGGGITLDEETKQPLFNKEGRPIRSEAYSKYFTTPDFMPRKKTIWDKLGVNKPSLANLNTPESRNQVAFGLLFGGLPTAAGAAFGASIGGSSGGLLGSTITQTLTNSINLLRFEFDRLAETAKEAGLAFERSILGISAVNQANTIVTSKNGVEVPTSVEFAFQAAKAKEIQLTAREKLLPLGIAGQTEATFVQGITSALAQRGIQGTPQQIARIAELIGGAIQSQRPSLLENPTLLLRDIQDVLGGGPLAQRTVLSQLIKPAFGAGLQRAKSGGELVTSLESLSAYPEIATGLDNPIVAINKFQGALDNLNTAIGTSFLDAVIPAIKNFTEVLQDPDTKKAGETLGTLAGQLGGFGKDLAAAAVGFATNQINFVGSLSQSGPAIAGMTRVLGALGLAVGALLPLLQAWTAKVEAQTGIESASIKTFHASAEARVSNKLLQEALGDKEVYKGSDKTSGIKSYTSTPFLQKQIGQIKLDAEGNTILNKEGFPSVASKGGGLGSLIKGGVGLVAESAVPLAYAGLLALDTYTQYINDQTEKTEQADNRLGQSINKYVQLKLELTTRRHAKVEGVLNKLGLKEEATKFTTEQSEGPSYRIKELTTTLDELKQGGSETREELLKSGPSLVYLIAGQQNLEAARTEATNYNPNTLYGQAGAAEFNKQAAIDQLPTLEALVKLQETNLTEASSKTSLDKEQVAIKASLDNTTRELTKKQKEFDKKYAYRGIAFGEADELKLKQFDIDKKIDQAELDKEKLAKEDLEKQLKGFDKGLSPAVTIASDALKNARKMLADGILAIGTAASKAIDAAFAIDQAKTKTISTVTAGGALTAAKSSYEDYLKHFYEISARVQELNKNNKRSPQEEQELLQKSKIDLPKTKTDLVTQTQNNIEAIGNTFEELNKGINKNIPSGAIEALQNSIGGNQAVSYQQLLIATDKAASIDQRAAASKKLESLENDRAQIEATLLNTQKAKQDSDKQLQISSDKLREAINTEVLERTKLNFALMDSSRALQEFYNQASLRSLNATLGQVNPIQDFIKKYGYAPAGASSEALSAANNPAFLKDLQRQQAEEQIGAAGREFDSLPNKEQEEQLKLSVAVDQSRKALNSLTDSINAARAAFEDLFEKNRLNNLPKPIQDISTVVKALGGKEGGAPLTRPYTTAEQKRTAAKAAGMDFLREDSDNKPFSGYDIANFYRDEDDYSLNTGTEFGKQLNKPGNIVPVYKKLPGGMQEAKYDSVSLDTGLPPLSGTVSNTQPRYHTIDPETGKDIDLNLGGGSETLPGGFEFFDPDIEEDLKNIKNNAEAVGSGIGSVTNAAGEVVKRSIPKDWYEVLVGHREKLDREQETHISKLMREYLNLLRDLDRTSSFYDFDEDSFDKDTSEALHQLYQEGAPIIPNNDPRYFGFGSHYGPSLMKKVNKDDRSQHLGLTPDVINDLNDRASRSFIADKQHPVLSKIQDLITPTHEKAREIGSNLGTALNLLFGGLLVGGASTGTVGTGIAGAAGIGGAAGLGAIGATMSSGAEILKDAGVKISLKEIVKEGVKRGIGGGLIKPEDNDLVPPGLDLTNLPPNLQQKGPHSVSDVLDSFSEQDLPWKGESVPILASLASGKGLPGSPEASSLQKMMEDYVNQHRMTGVRPNLDFLTGSKPTMGDEDKFYGPGGASCEAGSTKLADYMAGATKDDPMFKDWEAKTQTSLGGVHSRMRMVNKLTGESVGGDPWAGTEHYGQDTMLDKVLGWQDDLTGSAPGVMSPMAGPVMASVMPSSTALPSKPTDIWSQLQATMDTLPLENPAQPDFSWVNQSSLPGAGGDIFGTDKDFIKTTPSSLAPLFDDEDKKEGPHEAKTTTGGGTGIEAKLDKLIALMENNAKSTGDGQALKGLIATAVREAGDSIFS